MPRILIFEKIRFAVVGGKGFDQFLGRFAAPIMNSPGRNQHQLHADGICYLGPLLRRLTRLFGRSNKSAPRIRRKAGSKRDCLCLIAGGFQVT